MQREESKNASLSSHKFQQKSILNHLQLSRFMACKTRNSNEFIFCITKTHQTWWPINNTTCEIWTL